ncbi:ABC transporter permease [Hoyosella rhizosphaerae]|uniref:ABC transporter permease n=1 Tax=Hoyosella rhizosphaerae TaxID=1755582 RepID=A0A916X8W3_9ACTN|nr:ABC transporter permease [Hoyosella rhizosphaerae]
MLAIAVVVAAIVSACLGQVATAPLDVASVLLRQFGVGIIAEPSHPLAEVTLLKVRFPRIVLALLVGACLGCAGALLQGVFANPLAEPGIVGVSAGAAVGASAVIVVGGAFAAAWSVTAAAFAGGCAATFIVYALARFDGRTEVVTLVVTGVAINAFCGGLIAFFTFAASQSAREQIVFWQLGSLNGATWQAVAVVAPLTVAGALCAVLLGRQLDLLALGEPSARHLGVNVERLKQYIVVVVAILVAAAVSLTGIIVFIGLVVPHLIRMIVGPAHRFLVPASLLGGALVLVIADLGARTLINNADLLLGMLTALAGGPFFQWLLRRTRARQRGWA